MSLLHCFVFYEYFGKKVVVGHAFSCIQFTPLEESKAAAGGVFLSLFKFLFSFDICQKKFLTLPIF